MYKCKEYETGVSYFFSKENDKLRSVIKSFIITGQASENGKQRIDNYYIDVKNYVVF